MNWRDTLLWQDVMDLPKGGPEVIIQEVYKGITIRILNDMGICYRLYVRDKSTGRWKNRRSMGGWKTPEATLQAAKNYIDQYGQERLSEYIQEDSSLLWASDLIDIPDLTNLWYAKYWDGEDLEIIVRGNSKEEARAKLGTFFPRLELKVLCPLSEKPNFAKAVFENNRGKHYDILKSIEEGGYYIYDEGY
jgi:hypothetical protein